MAKITTLKTINTQTRIYTRFKGLSPIGPESQEYIQPTQEKTWTYSWAVELHAAAIMKLSWKI